MRYGIVEGEPGIFPDPVARVLRGVGRWFRRDRTEKKADDAPSDPPASPAQDNQET